MEKFGQIQTVPDSKSTKEEIDRKLERRKEHEEKDEAFDVQSEGKFLSEVLLKNNQYSETIPLNSTGEINVAAFMMNAGRNMMERTRNSFDISKDGLNKLIGAIQEKFKNLRITLVEENNSIVINVESKIKKDTFVNWVSGGANQWSEPKRVVHISDDGQYAFFDGSMTGIPMSQLEAEI
jgi:hypothetical protein